MEARHNPPHPIPRFDIRDLPRSDPCCEHFDSVLVFQSPIYKDRNPDWILPFGRWSCGYTVCSLRQNMGQATPVSCRDSPHHSLKRMGRSIKKLWQPGLGKGVPRHRHCSVRGSGQRRSWRFILRSCRFLKLLTWTAKNSHRCYRNVVSAWL